MRIGNYQIENGKLIMIGAGVVIILLLASVFFGILPGSRPAEPERAKIEFWGLFDNFSVWKPIFDAYQKENSNVSFNYIQMDPDTYEQDLIEALASGKTPDIIMFKSSWLPKHGNKISPLPAAMMTLRDFQEIFPDIATIDFVRQPAGQIYALPVWTDVLVMLYNKDLFNTAGIATPPKNWDDFIKIIQKLTSKDKSGNLIKSGAAIGAANNVGNASDILSLLMLQSGAEMINSDGTEAIFDRSVISGGSTYKPGESALRFYTDFADQKSNAYTWNNKFQNSLDAFVSGQTAIIFDYAVNVSLIKQKASNLNLGIASMPQLAGAAKKINYADFWGYSVPAASKNSEAAWKFLVFLTRKDINEYFSQTVLRPASRRDVLSGERSSPDLGVFADSILSATNWYRVDPKAIDDIFKEMINSVVLQGVKPTDAIRDGAARVTSLMRRQ